uniref:NADH dehydrogenase subunit 4L n=1 Tax=Mukaria splendida TaxID=2586309 RepID=A0A7L8ZU70_9HEMI|nr:NADH dehydrogenase subunit 4L [Mukaria splendida]QOI73924.1 NADH dehydrogenase subunit 4L [Mukaria splendida]
MKLLKLILYLFTFMYMFSLFSLLLIRKHIFLSLLSLEFIVISLMMISSIFILFFYSSLYILVMMMVLFVCEGVLGLSILVSMIRFYGNDYLGLMGLW